MIKFILNLLFEEHCAGCRKSGSPVCLDCVLSAEPATEPNDMGVWSAFAFHDPVVRRSVQKLKYGRNKDIAKILAEALFDKTLELVSEKRLIWGLGPEDKIMLVPVPLSGSRLLQRGYNQAALVACAYADLDESMSFIVLNDVLYKTRDTASQVSVKDRKKRLENLRHAFAVKNKELIVDKCVILFDDVTTTGATLAECKKVLEEAGAREVFAITVAH